jgi:hypothetical protein
MRTAMMAGAMVLWGGVAAAETPEVKTAELDGHMVSFHLWPFLTEEETGTLDLVLVNQAALELFVPPGASGHAAMAVSPDDGFIRDGALVASATAIGGHGLGRRGGGGGARGLRRGAQGGQSLRGGAGGRAKVISGGRQFAHPFPLARPWSVDRSQRPSQPGMACRPRDKT